MLAVISPAKKLNFDPIQQVDHSFSQFQDQANILAQKAKTLSVSELRAMMNLSEELARLNRERFLAFAPQSDLQNAKQAAFAFAGDTYSGLQIADFNSDDLTYAQEHLRILSGLYGALRPLDLIQPYRLEMGRKLQTERGKTLYDFWGDRIAQAIEPQAGGGIINLASNEYFKSVKKHLKTRVITPAFKEDKGDKLVMISFFAKKARGMMARFIIQNRIDNPEHLKDFNCAGYTYRADLSAGDNWVFVRTAP